MKKSILLVLFLLITLKGWNQDCICTKNLDSLISIAERNYVGFSHKVTSLNSSQYEKFKDSLKIVSSYKKGYDCYLILKTYLLFFRDPHLSLSIFNPGGAIKDTINSIFNSFKHINLEDRKLKEYYRTKTSDSIEGIWQSPLVKYKVAIIRDTLGDKSYTGFILDGDGLFWFPGQEKMKIAGNKVKYYKNDHFPDERNIRYEKGNIIISGYGTWQRTFPVSKIIHPKLEEIYFRKLSKNISLLAINNFSIDKKRQIDSLVGANFKSISQSELLIIDLRNNSGGVTMSYDTLMPLLYTNPLQYDGFVVKASKDNIDQYRKSADNPIYEEKTRTALKNIVAKMEENPDSLVVISSPGTAGNGTVKPYPKKIAIIANEGTVSAAELFIFQAKQSKKVKIFGSNSRGALDYTEIGLQRPLPCPYLSFYCPMGMSQHTVYPYIDNVGIAPDVRIDKDVPDWIDYVIKHYKEK